MTSWLDETTGMDLENGEVLGLPSLKINFNGQMFMQSYISGVL